ncbi:DUF6732 family protein [Roseibium alexandrii]|uniref:DUF6732 family protein n=1 Tax=Roseibium alexandrii TaxID=388408 RepID=UPI0037516081
MTLRIILSAVLPFSAPSAAFAHAGHLGELAGHAHWVGAAALAGAALIAGVVAWASRKDKDSAADSDEADAEPGETAENPTP